MNHSNRMLWAILSTLFCCLVGGIVAIIHSSKSNSLYNSALLAQDENLQQSLYMQSELENRSAKNWIIGSIIFGFIVDGGWVILLVTGDLAGIGTAALFI